MKFLKAISAGELFELFRPAAFIISVLLSTWVLAGTRRRRWRAGSVVLWTAGAFFLPLVVFPLYLVAGVFTGRSSKIEAGNGGPEDDSPGIRPEDQPRAEGFAPEVRLRRTVPIFYLFAMLGIGTLIHYREWHSVDAHMARANRARLVDQKAKVIAEYSAALKIEDSPHLHNLLGQALMESSIWEKALAELQTAQKGGEPDDMLFYNIGLCMQNVGRRDEARDQFRRFLETPMCRTMDRTVCKAAAGILLRK